MVRNWLGVTSSTSCPRAIHASIIRDIYQNGRVLSRKKYRLLGYAYRMLLGGLIAGFLTFVAPFAQANDA